MSAERRTDNTAQRAATASAAISARVAEADQADFLGQHDRAVDLLATACMHGDVEAMTRLGKRLLVAANAPFKPAEGTELIVKAANLGGAEAAAQLAVLAGIGMHMKQNWDMAIAAIVFAAERGSLAAQGQLRALATDRDLAANVPEVARTDPTLWARLARSIDLNRWHVPSAGTNLSDSPLVRHFPDFAPAEVCQWLIERARGRLFRAKVYDPVAKRDFESSTRTNTCAIFNLTHSDLVSVLLQVQMCASTGLTFRQLEPTTVLHYDVGEEISNHYDFIDPSTPNYAQEVAQQGQRVVTFLVYLNDDYGGGETAMPTAGISHKGRRGEGLFFVNAFPNGDPDLRTVHAGRPPTRGDKWIVSQFFRSRATF